MKHVFLKPNKYQHVYLSSEQNYQRDSSLGIELDGVYIEGQFLYLKCDATFVGEKWKSMRR